MNSDVFRVPRHSPWEKVYHWERYADGIYQVSTEGHGGIGVHKRCGHGLPDAVVAAGDHFRDPDWMWYEEDLEWAIPVAFMPHLFAPERVQRARRTVVQEFPHLATLLPVEAGNG